MKKPRPFIFAATLVVGASLALAACSPAATPSEPESTGSTVTMEAKDSDKMMDKNMDKEAVPTMNIVETAQDAGSFATLLAAAEAAGLVETLSTAEVTVLAPTDEAFAKLPPGTIEGLLEKPADLADILKYHVISGTVPSTEVVKLDAATTLQGQDVSITTSGEKVMINDATVVTPDIMTSNGIIHVIDTVLLPE